MALVNKRLFGTPISGSVSASLAARQSVSGDVDFGQSILDTGTSQIQQTGTIPNITEKSSRTPFVRMWTSVKLISPANMVEHLDEIPKEEWDNATKNADYAPITKRRKAVQKLYNIANIKDIDTKIMLIDGVKRYFIVNKNEDAEAVVREKIDYTEKVT